MPKTPILDLAECTEFRQTLLARPPRIVHGAFVLFAGLILSGLAWSAWTEANLVVRAGGRVRAEPAGDLSGKVFNTVSGGRVCEVNFRQGGRVERGQVLLRLETDRLDNEIEKRRLIIRAAEEELAKLTSQQDLIEQQWQATQDKMDVQLDQSLQEVERVRQRQASDLRLSEKELQAAQLEETQLRRLAAERVVSRLDWNKTAVRLHEAREKWTKAKLPVDDRQPEVLRRERALIDKDFAMRRQELALKQAAKQAEAGVARTELDNLELERRQTVLQAPMDGVAISPDVKVGQILETGKPVVEIADNRLRFEVKVRNEELAHLSVGMPVRIKLDAYDYQKYGTLAGRVEFIAPDSTAAEGLESGAFFQVWVRLEENEVGGRELHGPVKLGMAGQAEIVTGTESLLGVMLKRIRQSISLG